MTEKLIFPLDRYHLGIRMAVLLTMFIGAFLGLFLIMPFVTDALGLTQVPDICVSLIGAIVIGVGGSWLVEQGLLNIWRSGKWLVLDDNHVEIRTRRSQPISINWAGHINVQTWYFVVTRGRALVPRGWYCLACRLAQDEQIVLLYTFTKPDEAQKLSQWPAFEQLISSKRAPKLGEEQLLTKVAEQSQLRIAEKERWENGVEMASKDFFELVKEMDAHLPNWPEPQAKS